MGRRKRRCRVRIGFLAFSYARFIFQQPCANQIPEILQCNNRDSNTPLSICYNACSGRDSATVTDLTVRKSRFEQSIVHLGWRIISRFATVTRWKCGCRLQNVVFGHSYPRFLFCLSNRDNLKSVTVQESRFEHRIVHLRIISRFRTVGRLKYGFASKICFSGNVIPSFYFAFSWANRIIQDIWIFHFK